MTTTYRDYLDFAIETAWQAGQLTLGYFQTGLRPDFKAEHPILIGRRQAQGGSAPLADSPDAKM